MAVVWLMIEDGRYIPAAELFQRTQNTYVHDLTRESDCRYVDVLFPHPYLGFVHHGNPPCGMPNINNVGMLNDDYPTLRRTDRYTILLTGGSVASQVAQIGWPPSPRILEEELNDNYLSPNGQPFLVLNGGAGAWKQPQPFILFALNAQALDCVITLVGMNELYLFRHYERVRLEWPLGNFMDVNPLVADTNFGDAAIAWVMGRVAGMVSRNPVLGRSHAAYIIVRGIEAAAKGSSGWKSNKRTTLDSLFALPPGIAGEGEGAFATQLALLQKYHRLHGARQRRQGGLLLSAGSGLRQDADRRGEGRRRRSVLWWALSPHGRGHVGPARARHGSIRPGRSPGRYQGNHLRRSGPLSPHRVR